MKNSFTFGSLFLVLIGFGCQKKKEATADTGAKMRGTGITTDFSLFGNPSSGDSTLATMLANVVELESFKMPIRSIRLAKDTSGSGYGFASDPFYSCANTKTDAECEVDLTQASSLDNLLGSGNAGEMVVESDISYDGVSVGMCADNIDNKTSQFSIKLKGKATLGSTVYYTSATEGLSSALTAAEEAVIKVDCYGALTPLPVPVILGPEKKVNIVLYGDPNGNAFATTNKTLANAYCTGAESLALCTTFPAIFGTVDDKAPKVERYFGDVTTEMDGVHVGGNKYRDLLFKVIADSSDTAFGASIQDLYLNDSPNKLLHKAFILSDIDKNSDGTYNLGSFGTSMVDNFIRGDAAGLTLKKNGAEAEVKFNLTKL